MATIKQKVIDRINQIEDEELLKDVYNLLYGMQETRMVLRMNEEQRNMVEEGLADYERGDFYSTEDLFRELLDDEE
jgi:bacterioferritin (cytochrome b1)